MTAQSENTKRIAKNTLMLYVRMLFSMLVSLYTSRVVLNTLGVEDYGIYNVVGGFVAMFSLVSSSLSSASSRFLTFELGKGDMEQLKRVFSTSLLIHVILSVIVLVLSETIGAWFLNTQMTIPAERLHAANWVFRASVLSFILGLLCVSFNASIISHEHMKVFAFIGILEVILRLAIVLFIAHSALDFDRLVAYSFLLLAVSVSLQCVYFCYCRKHFEECRLRFCLDRKTWKEMSSFAGWNFIGCTAGLLKGHGVNVLFNLFFGPVLNAARGISDLVNTAIYSFAGNFMTALNPQITKSYASGERMYMMSLVERGSRFSYYIVFVLALPILFETEFVLALWLKQYPDHTVNFVRLVLVFSLCDVLSNTLITLQSATGKIRNYQLAVGGMLMLNFPFAYICLKTGLPPESVLVVALLVSVMCLILRLVFLKRMASLSIRSYLCKVCLNVATVSMFAAIIPCILHMRMGYGWVRFLSVSCVCLLCSSLSIYVIGCSASERRFILDKIGSAKDHIIKRRSI